jgi:hypothetical protein
MNMVVAANISLVHTGSPIQLLHSAVADQFRFANGRAKDFESQRGLPHSAISPSE